MDINGAIVLYKEKGISSFSAASRVRKIVGANKAGHTGTLDPMAEGILVICFGKHTRLTEYLLQDEKAYRVTMFLGISTDTFDLEGNIQGYSDVRQINENKLIETIEGFKGIIEQKPPVYSAIKVEGRKLYDYARKGIEVEVPSRTVYIHDITNINISNGEYMGYLIKNVSFDVKCSKGTYIRSLCNDIGTAMNSHGAMADLIRTGNGRFGLNDAVRIDEIQKYVSEGRVNEIIFDPIPYCGLKSIILNEDDSKKYLNGLNVLTEKESSDYLAVLSDGTTAGIGKVDKDGNFRSRKRLI
ncbi:MAG: tRNA pseudouridine(55) synthase TruB [Clostridia bacterium]|nr:tRNA pseudouridine(55) synthase TruB [Clostridia bacterium]MBN2882336.1 tRNA pseudouridine(55) synthase TruB [Clostridia bacterium]